MPRFVVFSKLSPRGYRALLRDPAVILDLHAEVERVGGKVVDQFALLGPYDFCTIIDVRDNDAAFQLAVADRGEAVVRTLLPAIDLNLFVRLVGQTTETTGPHRWQISVPARIIRRPLGRFGWPGRAAKYFKPFTVIGKECFDDVRGPAIFIANHVSFMDGAAMWAALPRRYQHRIAWPAAADRAYIKGRKELRNQGWWFSLVFNGFPMQRGGGRAALSYTDWLIGKGWSIGIFPEGARTSAVKLARFRLGAAILATSHGLPVVPMYMDGLHEIRPKGSREMKPGPVTVRVGRPLRFPKGSDPNQANHELHRAVDALRVETVRARHDRHDPAAVAPARAGSDDAR
jgi:1-acyl-sn-glycerol-3-phosphate acyltransferase/uncharacterized protein with GYD domain